MAKTFSTKETITYYTMNLRRLTFILLSLTFFAGECTTPTPASFSYFPNSASFVSGSTAASSVAPTYINGTAGTYSITSGGTTGITIDATTGVLSWKGNIAVGTYTMSVTNAAGGNAPFTLTVTPAPSFSYSPNSVSFISDDVAKGSSVTPIYTNGTAGAYSIASGGTTGITIDAATGVLSWSGRILPATYAINVTNAAGGSSTFSLTVTLAANYAAINGKIYKTVTIGTQTWMAENLNDAAHDNGISSCYDNEDEKCKQYGRLYNWAAANDIDSKISGWHLPSNVEWTTLVSGLGGDQVAGRELKVGGSTGFNALYGGSYLGGKFTDITINANFWTSTPDGTTKAKIHTINNSVPHIFPGFYNIESRVSVRLLKD